MKSRRIFLNWKLLEENNTPYVIIKLKNQIKDLRK